jgi:CO/xanthine dehydrogenase FAD-binding subunit
LKTKGTKTASNILSLSRVADLKGIHLDDKGLTIKAMTTITELFESPLLKDQYQIFKTVCRNISTTPIRNMASFGGNLTCRYTWTEMPVTIMCLDATMFFMGPDGTVSQMSAEDFFKNNARSDFLFTHAFMPRNPQARLAYRRVRKMSEVDQPLITLCVKTDLKDRRWANTRVAINTGTAFAQRDHALEAFLDGKSSSATLGQEALEHLTASIYDTRSTDYKQHMFRVCLKQAIEELCKSN